MMFWYGIVAQQLGCCYRCWCMSDGCKIHAGPVSDPSAKVLPLLAMLGTSEHLVRN